MDEDNRVIMRVYVPIPVRELEAFGAVAEAIAGKSLAIAPGTEGATFDVVVMP
jgi:hypothetical protein